MNKLKRENWSDIEALNFIQILLVAKFDSDRSDVLSGSPVLNDLLNELLNWDFQDKLVCEFVGNLVGAELPAQLKEFLVSVLSDIDPKGDFNETRLNESIDRFIAPYVISDDERRSITDKLKMLP